MLQAGGGYGGQKSALFQELKDCFQGSGSMLRMASLAQCPCCLPHTSGSTTLPFISRVDGTRNVVVVHQWKNNLGKKKEHRNSLFTLDLCILSSITLI